MTDPFMYKNKEVKDLTLNIIQKLNNNNIRSTVLTKGVYPRFLTNKEKYGKLNEYGITLVSLNNKFKKNFEPNSAPYLDRIKSLKYLHDKGFVTWVSIEPYPTPNLDDKENLQKLLEKIKFVDRIVFGKLNYNVKSSQFEGHENYYEDRAKQVVKFCKKNNILHHIKFGTQKKYNKKTALLFKSGSNKKLSDF